MARRRPTARNVSLTTSRLCFRSESSPFYCGPSLPAGPDWTGVATGPAANYRQRAEWRQPTRRCAEQQWRMHCEISELSTTGVNDGSRRRVSGRRAPGRGNGYSLAIDTDRARVPKQTPDGLGPGVTRTGSHQRYPQLFGAVG